MKLHIDETKEFLVIDECTSQEYVQLQSSYNKEVKNYRFNPKYKNGLWDGKINFMVNRFLPATTYQYLIGVCKQHGFECHIDGLEGMFDTEVDYDGFKSYMDDLFSNCAKKPRYYQIDAAYNMLRNRRCMIQIATGGGKTFIAFMVFMYLLYYKKITDKVCMVVPRVDLVLQPTDDFLEYNGGKFPIRIQQIYSGCKVMPEANIFIGTYQSLRDECPEYFGKFGCVLTDECHTATNASQIKISEMLKCPYRFGMSGTIPGTKYADGLTLIKNFGPVVTDIPASLLQEEGYISRCKIHQIRLDYTSQAQKDAFKKAKKMCVESGNGAKMFKLENDFVNESEKRFNVLMKLISNVGKNTMVLFKNKDYGKKIFRWLKENTTKMVYYIDGDIDKNVRAEIRDRMEVKNDVVLVASFGTSATGISIDKIFNVFFVSSYKSMSVVLQSIGRGLRKNDSIGKDFVNIYDISDDLYKGCYEMNHARERLKLYDMAGFPFEIKTLKF
jgi:superfamily II DNA or RNA helicase